MKYAVFATLWGDFALVARDGRVVASYLLDSRQAILKRINREWPDALGSPDLLPGVRQDVQRYFEGEPISFDCEIDLSGVTPFRRRVLEICREIPYGETSSYGELARFAGSPAAARAVGGAMAHNPIALIVPCHRVLRSDGSLVGFTSPRGTDLKQRMLTMERQTPDACQQPTAAARGKNEYAQIQA